MRELLLRKVVATLMNHGNKDPKNVTLHAELKPVVDVVQLSL